MDDSELLKNEAVSVVDLRRLGAGFWSMDGERCVIYCPVLILAQSKGIEGTPSLELNL